MRDHFWIGSKYSQGEIQNMPEKNHKNKSIKVVEKNKNLNWPNSRHFVKFPGTNRRPSGKSHSRNKHWMAATLLTPKAPVVGFNSP